MLMILRKINYPEKPNVDCEITVAHDGMHKLGTLHFPNKITWSRFYGAFQRGAIGMRDFEVRIDLPDEAAPAAPAAGGGGKK